MKASIIVNPMSGGRRTGRMWGEIRDEVRSRLGGLVEFTTQSAGDATRYATQAAHDGDTELLVIAGGDGTINETINGLFNEKNEPVNPNLKIGILSAGRGCDFIRSLDIPQDFRKAVDLLINPRFRKVDVGCAFFRDEFGREKNRYFINVASAGLGAHVAKKVNHTPRFLPPEVAYFGSAVAAFFTVRPQNMKITVDEKVVFEGEALNVFVANGKYSGAGMCWAPMAKVDDGLFEVIIAEPMPKYKIIVSGHKLYDGSFLSLPGVHHFKGKTALIESLDEVLLELDGEAPGVAPLGCSILPQALTFAAGT